MAKTKDPKGPLPERSIAVSCPSARERKKKTIYLYGPTGNPVNWSETWRIRDSQHIPNPSLSLSLSVACLGPSTTALEEMEGRDVSFRRRKSPWDAQGRKKKGMELVSVRPSVHRSRVVGFLYLCGIVSIASLFLSFFFFPSAHFRTRRKCEKCVCCKAEMDEASWTPTTQQK